MLELMALTAAVGILYAVILYGSLCPKCRRLFPHRRGCPLGWRREDS